jgi:hypothetical protein
LFVLGNSTTKTIWELGVSLIPFHLALEIPGTNLLFR